MPRQQRFCCQIAGLQYQFMLKRLLLLFVVCACLLVYGAYKSSYQPAEIQVIAAPTALAPLLKIGQKLTLLSWNINFLGGNPDTCLYFENHCSTTTPLSNKQLQTHFDTIIQTIQRHNPDLVLLQAVDVDATRSQHENQIQKIARALPAYTQVISAPNWYVPFFPHPKYWGRYEMHLVILSKYRIDAGKRYQLPMPLVSFLENFLSFKSAIVVATLPLANSTHSLRVANTELLGYGKSPKIRDAIQTTKNLLGHLSEKNPSVLGGSFYLPPPDFQRDRLPQASTLAYFYPDDYPLSLLYSAFQGRPLLKDLNGKNYNDWLTYQTPDAIPRGKMNAPSDYLFISHDITIDRYTLLSEDNEKTLGNMTNHLPQLIQFTLPPP